MSARAKRQQATRRRSSSIRKRLIWVGVLGLVLVIVVSGLFAATSRLGTSEGESLAAEPAADITLASEAGDFQLSDLRGQVVLLYFSFPG